MKTSTVVYIIAAIVVFVMLTKKRTAGKQAVAEPAGDGILEGQGAYMPLDYPNLFSDAGAYNSL